MPVIQTYDPLTAASEAVGSYVDAKRKTELDKAAAQYQQGRDARTDMESDRTYKMQQGAADDAHLRTQAEIKSGQQRDAIAAADEAFTRSQDGINREISQATLGGKITENKAAAIDLKVKAIQARYAADLAKAGLTKEQADAKAAQAAATTSAAIAKYAGPQAAANLSSTQASTASTQASTAESQFRMAHGEDTYHAPASGTTSTRASDAYDAALEGLSAKGQEFYGLLYNTNNPPTRPQAMLALQASKRGSGLDPKDYPLLEQLIGSRESQFVTPGEQQSSARSDASITRSDTRHQHTDREQEYHDVTRGRAFLALPDRLKQKVQRGMVHQGYSIDELLQMLPQEQLSDADKAAITHALTTP